MVAGPAQVFRQIQLIVSHFDCMMTLDFISSHSQDLETHEGFFKVYNIAL